MRLCLFRGPTTPLHRVLRRSRAAGVLTALLGLAALVTAPPTAAQPTGMGQTSGSLGAAASVRSRGLTSIELPATTPLEGALDEQTYRVGPGDVFVVTAGGGAPMQATAPVTADGQIVLPQAGAIRVAGLTLAAARARIMAALRPYVVSGVDAALVQPRAFYVHVSGAVAIPGRIIVPPGARLEDALHQALAVDSVGQYIGSQPALRSVRIQTRGGASATYDLLRYRRLGDLTQNPYLGDGDAITVARFDDSDYDGTVRVMGDVAFPGLYEWRAGDTTADLVALANGPTRAGLDRRMVRVGSGPMMAIADATQPVSAGTTIYVERDRDRGAVRVDGAVVAPGTYAVRQGQTTLREVLAAAGGLRSDALARGAYLVRGGGGVRAFDATTLQGPGDLPYVTRVALADQFYQSRVAVAGLLTGGGDLPVFDGDLLVVPRDEGTVLLVGAVGRAGYLPVRAGATAETYLADAGGLRREARDVFVIDVATQTLAPAAGRVLTSGDVLLVTTDDPATRPELYGFSLQERSIALQSETLALQDRQERRAVRFQTLSLGLTTVSTAVALVTTYLLIRNGN